jgi:hypothetical protein
LGRANQQRSGLAHGLACLQQRAARSQPQRDPHARAAPQDPSAGGRGRAQPKAPGAFKSGQSRRRCLDFGPAAAAAGAQLQQELAAAAASPFGSAADLAALGLQGAGLPLRQVLQGLPAVSTLIPVQRAEGDAAAGGALDCEERLQGDEQQEERGQAGQGSPGEAAALAAAAAAAEGAALQQQQQQQGQQQRGRRSSRSSRRAQPVVYDEEPEEPDTETEEWEAEQNVVRRAQRSSRRARRQVQRLVEEASPDGAAAAAPRGGGAAQPRLPHRHGAHEAAAAEQLQAAPQHLQHHQPGGSGRPQRGSARPRPEARADGGADGTPDRRLSFASAVSMSVLAPYTPDERCGPT